MVGGALSVSWRGMSAEDQFRRFHAVLPCCLHGAVQANRSRGKPGVAVRNGAALTTRGQFSVHGRLVTVVLGISDIIRQHRPGASDPCRRRLEFHYEAKFTGVERRRRARDSRESMAANVEVLGTAGLELEGGSR